MIISNAKGQKCLGWQHNHPRHTIRKGVSQLEYTILIITEVIKCNWQLSLLGIAGITAFLSLGTSL